MKVSILGYSGSGKSTLAREISKKYNIPVLHLDTLNFLPKWEMRDRDEAKGMKLEFMEKNSSWVIEGNYDDFHQEKRLGESDKIIILDYNRITCLYRVIKRYFQNKNKTRVDMASGCIEKIDLEFVWWVIGKGRKKEKRSKLKYIEDKYQDKVVVIRNQRELKIYETTH